MKNKFYFSLKPIIYTTVFCSFFRLTQHQKLSTTEQVHALATLQIPIESGNDINITNENGDTALHLAIRKNQLNTVKFLLDQGANVNIGLIPQQKPIDKSTSPFELF